MEKAEKWSTVPLPCRVKEFFFFLEDLTLERKKKTDGGRNFDLEAYSNINVCHICEDKNGA